MSSSSGSQSLPPQYLEAYIGHELVAVAAMFIVLDIICVTLRIFARHLSKARPGPDDYLVVPSLIFCVAVCAICITMVEIGGVGRHAAAFESDPSVLVRYVKLEVAFIYIYLFAVTVPKLAILSLYLRIFPEKPYRSACYVLSGVLVASLMANITAVSVACIPLKALWDPPSQGAHCINQNAFFRYSTLPNIITDLCMLILPLPVIWRMSLSTRDKLVLSLTFCTGSIGIIASILRFAAFVQTNDTTDPTWSSVKLAISGITESGVYLIASCLPTYRTILFHLQKVVNSIHLSKSRKTSKTRSGRRTGDENANVQLDNLGNSTQKTGYGNTALAKSYTYDSDIAHLVDPLRFQDVHSSSPSLEAGIACEEGIRVKNDFIITSDSKE